MAYNQTQTGVQRKIRVFSPSPAHPSVAFGSTLSILGRGISGSASCPSFSSLTHLSSVLSTVEPPFSSRDTSLDGAPSKLFNLLATSVRRGRITEGPSSPYPIPCLFSLPSTDTARAAQDDDTSIAHHAISTYLHPSQEVVRKEGFLTLLPPPWTYPLAA